MARLPAELRRFHVFDSTVSELRSYEHVQNSREPEEPCQARQRSLAVESSFGQAVPDRSFRQIDTNRDEGKPNKEESWQNQKKHNSKVGVINVTPDLLRQDK